MPPTMMKYFGGHVEVSNPLVKLTYDCPNPSFCKREGSFDCGAAELRACGRHDSTITSNL